MKRTVPLRRKTPLRRGGRLNPVSARRLAASAIYFGERENFLREHPICQVCGSARSRDVHHTAGRYDGAYLNRATWIAVCRRCHNKIHRQPKWARQKGYLK